MNQLQGTEWIIRPEIPSEVETGNERRGWRKFGVCREVTTEGEKRDIGQRAMAAAAVRGTGRSGGRTERGRDARRRKRAQPGGTRSTAAPGGGLGLGGWGRVEEERQGMTTPDRILCTDMSANAWHKDLKECTIFFCGGRVYWPRHYLS